MTVVSEIIAPEIRIMEEGSSVRVILSGEVDMRAWDLMSKRYEEARQGGFVRKPTVFDLSRAEIVDASNLTKLLHWAGEVVKNGMKAVFRIPSSGTVAAAFRAYPIHNWYPVEVV